MTATEAETREDFYPNYSAYLGPLFRGPMPANRPTIRCWVPAALSLAAMFQQVIDKLMMLREMTGATRYVGQIDIGGRSFSDVSKGIELFATKVAPALRNASA